MNRRTFFSRATSVSAVSVSCALAAQAQEPEQKTDAGEASASPVEGYNYARPNIRKGSRLVFIGDSITDMKWGRKESDRNHYLGHSFVYLIASRLGVDMPDAELEFFNRGQSGNRIHQLKARWQKDVIDMKPDLLTILVGVNGSGQLKTLEAIATWEADYRHCLTEARKANPELRLILLDPFVLNCGKLVGKRWEDTRPAIDKQGVIVAKLAKEFDATHIETQKIFDTAAEQAGPDQWIWDGVHPLPQGHELIARSWVQALS